MPYNLTDVKSIKVISNPDDNPVAMTLNKNFKINPAATFDKVKTAMNRIYNLSDLNADQIILDSEFNMLAPTINYEIISGEPWYLFMGPKGTLVEHEVELNTVENILDTKFTLPYGISDKAIAIANNLVNTNTIRIKLATYVQYNSITTVSGKLLIITPSKAVNLSITMYVNQSEPEP